MLFARWLLLLFAWWLPSPPAAFDLASAYAGTAADDAAVGTLTWADPSNAVGSGTGSYATVTTEGSSGSEYSHYLKVTNYGFSIPAGATINGVQVRIRAVGVVENSGDWAWDKVRLVNDSGTVGTANKATGNLPTVASLVTFGGSADTWSGEATAINWNDVDSGAAIAVGTTPAVSGVNTAYLDYVEITVTYTPAPTTLSPRRRVIGQARKFEMVKRGADARYEGK